MRLLGVHNDQRHGPHISSIVPYMGVLHRGEYLYWIVHTPILLVGPRVTAALQAISRLTARINWVAASRMPQCGWPAP